MAAKDSKIKFSTRPLTLGEMELLGKAAIPDVTAIIDLWVSRSDPKVTRSMVENLTESEITDCVAAFTESMNTISYIRNLFDNMGGS